LITHDAWLSPDNGSNAVFFLIVVPGTIVITRVQKLDSSLAFLLTFAVFNGDSYTYWDGR
jgi:hypothetical protein